MPLPWLAALKVIPWGDVIEHAPSVLKAARKLMDRQPQTPPGQAGTPATQTPVSAVPSLGELKNALIAAQGQIDRQAQAQRELAETLAELAEQNARLVSAVEVLRLRTRVLVWGGAAMLLWLAVLTWKA
jgi:L-fucose isomerase-like protein